MVLAKYEDWLNKPHETWEIANRLRLHEEAIIDCLRALNSEKWDKERKKRLRKELDRLQAEKEAFEKVKWARVLKSKGKE